MAFELGENDVVVTAYAQPAAGPGWANAPVWVIVQDRSNGSLRQECLQPHEQGEDVLKLYKIATVVHGEFVDAIRSQLEPPQRARKAIQSAA
jgi:hypothetical protein